MKNYFHVPELDLTSEQRSNLLKKFLLKKDNELKGYSVDFKRNTNDSHVQEITQKSVLLTYYTDIDFISEFFSNDLLEHIKSISLNPPSMVSSPDEFFQNVGHLNKHSDKVRETAIIIPITDPSEIKLDPDCNKIEWWDKEGTEIIDTLDYGFKTWILNVKCPHSMLTASRTRVSFQISIFDYTFKEIKEMYDSGKLFKN